MPLFSMNLAMVDSGDVGSQLDLRLAQLEERRADFLVGNLFDRITFQTQYVFPIGNRLIQAFDCNAKMLNVRYFHNFKRFN